MTRLDRHHTAGSKCPERKVISTMISAHKLRSMLSGHSASNRTRRDATTSNVVRGVMRTLTLISLIGVLGALAGCNSASDTPLVQSRDEKQTEEHLKEGPSARTAGALPSKIPDKEISGQFIDSQGHQVDLASFRGKSNVVLVVLDKIPYSLGRVFYPGALPQVSSLTANFEEFKKRNAVMLMVIPCPKDELPTVLRDLKVDDTQGHPKVPFEFLVDPDFRTVKALGLSADLGRPATFVIDVKGNMVFAFVGESTTDRPSVQAMLTQMDKVNTRK
jgi:peroxiredoxin